MVNKIISGQYFSWTQVFYLLVYSTSSKIGQFKKPENTACSAPLKSRSFEWKAFAPCFCRLFLWSLFLYWNTSLKFWLVFSFPSSTRVYAAFSHAEFSKFTTAYWFLKCTYTFDSMCYVTVDSFLQLCPCLLLDSCLSWINI